MTVNDKTVCVAPTGYFAGALGRLKGPLRRSTIRCVAPLTRPARSRGEALIGATPARSSWTDVSILEYNVSAE